MLFGVLAVVFPSPGRSPRSSVTDRGPESINTLLGVALSCSASWPEACATLPRWADEVHGDPSVEGSWTRAHDALSSVGPGGAFMSQRTTVSNGAGEVPSRLLRWLDSKAARPAERAREASLKETSPLALWPHSAMPCLATVLPSLVRLFRLRGLVLRAGRRNAVHIV